MAAMIEAMPLGAGRRSSDGAVTGANSNYYTIALVRHINFGAAVATNS